MPEFQEHPMTAESSPQTNSSKSQCSNESASVVRSAETIGEINPASHTIRHAEDKENAIFGIIETVCVCMNRAFLYVLT